MMGNVFRLYVNYDFLITYCNLLIITIQDITKPGRVRNLLRSTTFRWPSLRATALLAVYGGDNENANENTEKVYGRDFSLIPRALQVEEDLVRIVNDYRSLVYAGSLS